MPRLYDCILTFQFADGSPVAGASVTLVPENAELMQWSFSGVTNASGVVRIRAHGDFPGAPAGNYKVVISKAEASYTGQYDEDGSPIVTYRYLIHTDFSSPSRTPLSLNIPERAVNETFTVRE